MSQPIFDHPVIDFHAHYIAPSYGPAPPAGNTGFARALREMGDLGAVLQRAEAEGIARRVLNAAPAQIGGDVALESSVIRALNDHLAGVVAAHSDRLAGLAGIDLWAGDAVDQLTHAHEGLGFRGIVADAAQAGSGRLLNDPAVLPALRRARDLGLTVFLHPVSAPALIRAFEGSSRAATLLARGAIDAASILALLDLPELEEFSDLDIVIPAIGATALLYAPFAEGLEDRLQTAALHVDTMGQHPGTIRWLVERLGAARVVVGTDSPIIAAGTDRRTINAALAAAGLTTEQAALVAHGNAARLLSLEIGAL